MARLQGAALDLVLSDELTFGEWRNEFPDGQVLAPVAKYTKEYDSNWEPEVAKLPVVISFPGTELKSRDVVIGLTLDGAARAYPWETFAKQSPVLDRVNGTPLLLFLDRTENLFVFSSAASTGAMQNSFCRPVRIRGPADGKTAEKKSGLCSTPTTNSQWNFQGCATSGPAQGKCLAQVPALKDYWFDWRNYHPNSTIYKR